MKRIVIWGMFLLVVLGQGCDSALDVKPENAVTFTNFFENEQDLEALTLGMHTRLTEALRIFYAQEYVGAISETEPGGPEGSMRMHVWNYACQWIYFYGAIYQCNLLFDNVKSPVCEKERMNFYFGQAKFVKAVCYFELGRRWGDAVITGYTEEAPRRAKSPATEVLDTALANAEAAFRLLPTQGNVVDRNGKLIRSKQYGNKGNTATLIANIYAWRAAMDKGLSDGQRKDYWEKADEWASKVIDSDQCGNYDLEKTVKELVAGTMNARVGKESIFEIELNTDDGTIAQTPFNSAKWFVGFPIIPAELPGSTQRNRWKLSNDRILLMYPGNDERRQEYFYKFDDYSSADSVAKYGNFAFVYKYRERVYATNTGTGQTLSFVNFDVNRIYWRLADLILLRAEARYHIGNISGAIEDLDKVRGRAHATLFKDAPEPDLKLAIYKEREKELLFEDQRFFDVLRNGYVKDELPEFYSTLTEDDINNGALYLPIPDGAFYLNPLMIQSVYWLNKL